MVIPQHPLEMILARELASHVAVPMMLVDADGEVVYVNDSARPFLWGSSEGSERVGSVSEVFLTEDGHPDLGPFRSVLREGRPAHAPPVREDRRRGAPGGAHHRLSRWR